MRDRSENERRASLRRSKTRGCDAKRIAWARRILQKYGITPHDVALVWDAQRGRCALCETPLESKKVWVIDHDHRTKRFRGLLHAWCNHRVLSMIERGGFRRAYNALRYLWPIEKMLEEQSI